MRFKMKMQLMILGVLLISLSQVWTEYWQNDYILTLDRIEVLSYDKNYFSFMATKNFKFNRTIFAQNISFDIKQNFGLDLKIQLQAYKFASNEYRLFPVRLTFDVCDSIKKNDCGMQNIYKCGNFTRCPIKKGNYIICNFIPDYSRFPPYVPGGKYRSELIYIFKSHEIAVMEVYVEVKPKNSWEIDPQVTNKSKH